MEGFYIKSEMEEAMAMPSMVYGPTSGSVLAQTPADVTPMTSASVIVPTSATAAYNVSTAKVVSPSSMNGFTPKPSFSGGPLSLTQRNPWPFLADFFSFQSATPDGKNMIYKCVLCGPYSKDYRAQKKSLFSLRVHITRKHRESLDAFNASVQRRYLYKVQPYSWHATQSYESPNPAFLSLGSQKTESEFKSLIVTPPSSFTSPQASEESAVPSVSLSLEDRVVSFFAEHMLPLSIVESNSFKSLIKADSKVAFDCQDLKRGIHLKYYEEFSKLKEELNGVPYVGVAADIWKYNDIYAYLGVCGFWIDPVTLRRRKAVLRCQPIRRLWLESESEARYLREEIAEILSSFDIREKTRLITTDNGRNFPGHTIDSFGFEKLYQSIFCSRLEPFDANCDHLEKWFLDFSHVLSNVPPTSTTDYQHALPRSMRCAAHSFVLVVTEDAKAVLNLCSCSKLFKGTFSKIANLWTDFYFFNGRHKIPQDLGQELPMPSHMDWRQVYEALSDLSKILQSKEGPMALVCRELRIDPFTTAERTFLRDYVLAMRPLARTLDVLCSETQAFLGILLPTISVCLRLLDDVRSKRVMSECTLLVSGLMEKIKQRFEGLMNDDLCLLAAAFHPHFKLKWLLDDPEKTEELVEKMAMVLKEDAVGEESEGEEEMEEEEEDDFFRSLTKSGRTGGKRKGSVEQWLKEPVVSSKVLLDPSMFPSKEFMQAFIKFNVPVPASAALENFSTWGPTVFSVNPHITANRSFFRELVFLKMNGLEVKPKG